MILIVLQRMSYINLILLLKLYNFNGSNCFQRDKHKFMFISLILLLFLYKFNIIIEVIYIQ